MRSGMVVVSLALALAAVRTYELRVEVEPAGAASVSLQGAANPFSTSALADARGRARIRWLRAGSYTLAIVARGAGEWRQTIEIGPGTADSKGRVTVKARLKETGESAKEQARRRGLVSRTELSVPDRARREYLEGRKKLARNDVAGAVAHLERAVEIAPQYSAVWNHLGTIAYQTGQYGRAETCFRQALQHEPEAYDPLVNLGGVLLNLNRPGDALPFNLQAVSRQPDDALANSQLGMNYFILGRLEPGQQYLERAKQLDPAHFSHPQLLLAEIHLRRGEGDAAAAELRHFLEYHPDWPEAEKLRSAIAKLEQ